jgi:FkbM family methyltransferase
MLDRTVAYGMDFLFPMGDTAVGECLTRYGEFARPITDFLIAHATGAPGTLIDVGANLGSICLPFAKARPDWSVLAIEAHRGIAAMLSANALNNGLENVEVAQAAAGPTLAVTEFPNTRPQGDRNNGLSSLLTKGESMVPALMVTLDAVAPADTRLIKIDAEGNDADVLRGSTRLLNEVRPIWLIEAAVNHPAAAQDVIAQLLDAAYQVFWFYAPFAGFTTLKGREPPVPTTGDANVVALPVGIANLWDLPQVRSPTDLRPGRAADYPYLKRYGFC